MYRFSLKLKNKNLSKLRKWQKELKLVLGQHFSINEIIESILEQGLDLIEIDNDQPTDRNDNRCRN
jgi:hypothetical protein